MSYDDNNKRKIMSSGTIDKFLNLMIVDVLLVVGLNHILLSIKY